MNAPLRNQFAKVAVLCDEHPFLVQGARQHLLVSCAFVDFGDGNHIVAGLAQRLDYRHCAAFISHEVQPLVATNLNTEKRSKQDLGETKKSPTPDKH